MRKLWNLGLCLLAFLAITACTTTKDFTYSVPKLQEGWYMGNGASVGKEDGKEVFILQGVNDLYANYIKTPADFDFSGELRFEKTTGDNNWIAIQWAVQKTSDYAGGKTGYYLLFSKKGSYADLFIGPWTPNLKSLTLFPVGQIGNRYIKFRILRAGSHMTIYIDGEKRFEFDDKTYEGGHVGIYSWADKEITALYRNLEVK